MNIFGWDILTGQDIINIMDHVIISAKIAKRILIDRVFLKIISVLSVTGGPLVLKSPQILKSLKLGFCRPACPP